NQRKPDSPAVISDQKVKLPGYTYTFRRIHYVDPDTGNEYQFLTNSTRLKASEVAAIYKERWNIELFFKWINQNLKVKTFLGTSENAVLTQLWIALCLYLLLAYLKFQVRATNSSRVFQLPYQLLAGVLLSNTMALEHFS
ncbi:MAG: hypothetical protein ACD_35C00131G0001, partial [uncultured bacterium]